MRTNTPVTMSRTLALMFILCSFPLLGQHMTMEEWDEQAGNNIRMLPKYGRQEKTPAQKAADDEFIAETMGKEQFKGERRAASDHLIGLGFQYLYRGDLKTAMYRFNQAFLLDSTNVDIHWGYGAVYMTLENYAEADRQYREGLSVDPDNTHLLTDHATYFMVQYHYLNLIDGGNASRHLDTAIALLARSYELDPTDQNTSFKLSTCHWLNDDCDNAWKFHDVCEALGGQPITAGYTEDLRKKCTRKKK